MSMLLGSVSWSKLTGSSDDDWIDRINHLWTVLLMIIFAVVVSSGQYVGDPIHCWCPAQFTNAYVSYTKNYCWISNTYFIPMTDTIPVGIDHRQDREITYYQWVPMILLFQALLFKMPHIVWHMLNATSGINLGKVCEMVDQIQIGKPEERDATVLQIAKYINRWLRSTREYHNNTVVRIRHRLSNIFIFCFGKREGHYLTGFYLFVKLLYCANCVAQFYILDAFLNMDYGNFGFTVMKYLRENGELKESPRFPRVTLCDFEVRQLQNIQRMTVQCVLPINLFNEKIFIFLWFWLFLVAALTVFNFLSWLFCILFRNSRQQFIRKHLRVADEIQTGFDKKLARQFTDQFLRDDGVFLLRVIGKNSSDIMLCEVVKQIWKLYRQQPMCKKATINENDGDVLADCNGTVGNNTLLPTEKDAQD